MQKLKGILAIFCLAIFLLPMVEKEVHSYAHQSLLNCKDHNALHFHANEHHCFLCDFTHNLTSLPVPEKFSEADMPSADHYFFFAFRHLGIPSETSPFLRGPPVVG